MFIQRKFFLNNLKRLRVSEGRDLDNGLRLDRNEKVDTWPNNLLEEIFRTKKKWFLSVYPESTSLYSMLCKFHNIRDNQIMLSSGIDGAMKTLFEIMTEPGDLVGVVSPTYAMYKVYSDIFQVNLEEIIYKENLKFNFDNFETFLEKRPTIFFLPNPNQPIESYFNLDELRSLAKKTLDKNCLFVIDEAYHMFGSDTGIKLIEEFSNVVVMRTFSKGFGLPSIRLGYMISNEENMNILSKTRYAHESNSLSNAVAEYMLENYNLIEEYNLKIIKCREISKIKLRELGIEAYGEKGNYLLLDIHNNEMASKFVDYLKSKKIYIKGPWKGNFSKYVTITLGPEEVMQPFYEHATKFMKENSNDK